MNNRSVSDNLVNFSTDLATTLNQLESKEPLLSFPFDHLYACSDSGDRRQTLHLKEVEISTHHVAPQQDKHVDQRITSLERQMKKLKDLLIYHLDLVQQQNDSLNKKDKAYQALKVENEALRSHAARADVERQVALSQHGLIPQPGRIPIASTVTTTYRPDVTTYRPDITSYRPDVPTSAPQSYFNTYNEILYNPDDQTAAQSTYLYNPDSVPKPLPDLPMPDLDTIWTDLNVPSILEVTSLATETPAPTYTMVDNKRPKRETKNVEHNNEPKYTVTTNSGTAKISRNRKRTTGIGSFSRMPKTKSPKQQKSTIYDNAMFSVNAQSKKTYGTTKMPKYGYTALQERLQLIEPTPTGEDPYQIGEAEMREQSPIPKLMLQKNHSRMRISSNSVGGVTSTITSTTPTRRIYDTMSTITSSNRGKRTKQQLTEDPFIASNMHVQSKRDTANAALEEEPELDVEQTDNEIVDWRVWTTNKPKETSLCDFSYGETSANLVTRPLDITKIEFPDFFQPGPVNAESSNVNETENAPEQLATEKTETHGADGLAGPVDEETSAQTSRATEPKRGRKRVNSTAASAKRGDKAPAKPRGRRATRAKKTPVPGMTTQKLYHTSMGDPDRSWYLGIDPDVTKEDCDPPNSTTANVEVPRWREMSFSEDALVTNSEGTEKLGDNVFTKRHGKYEAEEKRQLRWHMRRIREQRHVEKLRQRQRDPWDPNSTQAHSRGDYTVWPQPVRDLQYIEITDTIPVTAFGEDVPDLPKKSFTPPWMRLSQALKKSSEESETLH